MNRFAQVPKAEIQRSSFDRSHGHKTTLEPGYLYPIFVDEALPGDTFNLKMHAIARLATPIFPIMDNIYLDTHFFAVPYRLLWDNWERFNGAQDTPASSTDFTVPTLDTGTIIAAGSLGDYFGLPVGTLHGNVSCLPFRAYNLIYNEWFRDQNLQNALNVSKTDGPDGLASYTLKRRGKRHDYFTSCLPWPQKGPSADVPILAGTANSGAPSFQSPGASPNNPFFLNTNMGTLDILKDSPVAVSNASLRWSDPNLMATVTSIREAFQIQKMFERDARGGTRYVEVLKAHFGVTSPDYRFQRPEYLGGGSQPINIAQIHQSSGTAPGGTGYTDTPLGQVGGIGTAGLDGRRNGFTQSFTEHCIIIGLISIRADMTYQNRLERMWSRRTRFDFFWPALAHIGEQVVQNKELYWSGTQGTDDGVFGYQERYGEYRYKPSIVTGLFRSDNATSLDAWHLAFDFTATPALNSTFIEENPPIDRVVAVPTEPKIIMDAWFEFQCARPMPMFGTPGLVDHF